jgi:hypothetical protein
MRIKGASIEAAAPNVQRLYRKAAQWFGRGHYPADRVGKLS